MGVFFGNIVWPPTLKIRDLDGEVGPQNSLNTETMALVSKRKLMGHPSTRMVTLGSWKVMAFVGESQGLVSHLTPGLRGLGLGWSDPPPPCGAGAIYCPVTSGMALGTRS